ncbi:MAG: hypothetical protein ABJC12_11745 [Saprospiraceae bacterium]
MEAITSDFLKDFLKRKDIELQPTHEKLCLPIINRLAKKMTLGIKFNAINVADGVIVDGHHRYLASLVSGADLEKRPYVRPAACVVTNWQSVSFDESDWDTEAKIQKLNIEDAEYNGIDIQEIMKLIN